MYKRCRYSIHPFRSTLVAMVVFSSVSTPTKPSYEYLVSPTRSGRKESPPHPRRRPFSSQTCLQKGAIAMYIRMHHCRPFFLLFLPPSSIVQPVKIPIMFRLHAMLLHRGKAAQSSPQLSSRVRPHLSRPPVHYRCRYRLST